MNKLILLLLSIFALSSCGKGPETITVRTGDSELFAAKDTTAETTDPFPNDENDFVQVKIGEVASIESLDPLFASSNSEWRIINLIYDRLVGIGSNGNLYPSLAKRWNVNSDSTQFTFFLKNNVSFQDSPAFESGTGRTLTANDVKYVFERMTKNDVPDLAGNYFKDIRGFEALRNEIAYVKDPAKRVITEIEGIRVQNDSTVTFILNQPSSDFLNRLSHPMASIYARESVPNSGPIQQAAGTGRFQFLQKDGNTHLLTVNNDHSANLPNINRLDIVSGVNERNLYQDFAGGKLDLLMELGPATLLTVSDSTGKLLSSFYNTFELHKASVNSEYPIYFNPESNQVYEVAQVLKSLNQNSVLISNALGSLKVVLNDSSTTQQNGSGLSITHTTHPFYLFMLNNIAPRVNQSGYSFSMNASYAFNNQVTFTTRPYRNTKKALVWDAPIYILSHTGMQGITVKGQPWNIDFSSFNEKGAN